MMPSGNLPPNAYQSMSSRVMRIPMRHTFTLEQKRILMKYFEQGMVGQSLMYQEKIQQCAQEASLEFDVVRNWIGNQRRKRRLEEVQRACMQNYIDQVPPGECNEGIPQAKIQTMTMAPPRQTQMLFLPHMAKQPGGTPPQQPLQGGPGGEGAAHNSEASTLHHSEPNQAQVNQLALTQLVPTNPNQNQSTTMVQAPQHASPRMPNRPVAPYLPGQPSSGYPSAANNDGMPPSSMPAQATAVAPPPQPASQRSNHSSPLGSDPSPAMAAGSMQDEEIGYHQTPIRGFYPGPRAPRMMPGGAHPGHPQQGMSPPSFTVYPSVKMMPPPKESPEMRHHEIRRIVEQIQMNLDRLEQLGCESLLATVSTADRSAYVCGTPIALQYFSKVNKDHPMAEYIHKQVSNESDFDTDALDVESPNVDNVGLEDQSENAESGCKENHKNETTMGIGQSIDGRNKMNPELTNEEEDEMDMMGDGEGIIKAGEEIYIVNKDRMVIGTGMLYPRPHEKMTFKSSPEYTE